MKKITIVGNWKSNKTVSEGTDWVKTFSKIHKEKNIDVTKISLVLCVPFTLLYPLHEEINKLSVPIELGVQDISPFPSGAYTGEISASMVHGLATYAMVGHTERRKYFHESDTLLAQKTEQAQKSDLKVIYCIFDEHAFVPSGVHTLSYEPVWAIGTGKPATPKDANASLARIKERVKSSQYIYGGSVTPKNVASFTKESHIDGVLPGGASLDPAVFYSLVHNAL